MPERDEIRPEVITEVKSETDAEVKAEAKGKRRGRKPKKDKAAAEWTRDMWEDYRNAGKEGKQYLIQKWGRPKK